MKKMKIALSTTLLSALLLPLQAAPTTLSDSHTPRDSYAPYNKDNYPKNVYFGDTNQFYLYQSYNQHYKVLTFYLGQSLWGLVLQLE